MSNIQFHYLTLLFQPNNAGKTALMAATEKGHQEIVELLTPGQVGDTWLTVCCQGGV